MTLAQFGKSVALKVRDAVYPSHIFKVRTEDGVLPYMRGDLLGWRFWTDDDFENMDRAVVRKLLKNCKVFIDAGANLGVYSLLASRTCGPGARIFSFEPSPVEFKKLELTVDWNDLANVIKCPVALSDTNGTLSFFESLEGRGALNRVDRPGDKVSRYRQTQGECARLDDYMSSKGVERIDFIKIDVEGHELPLLEGAANILKTHRPSLMIEMADKRASEVSTPEAIWAYLSSLRYTWLRLD